MMLMQCRNSMPGKLGRVCMCKAVRLLFRDYTAQHMNTLRDAGSTADRALSIWHWRLLQFLRLS